MSKNNAKELDQWFTKIEVAKLCVSKMAELGFIKEFTDVIEPSAGSGVFVEELSKIVDKEYIHAFDIDPKQEYMQQANWLETIPTIQSRAVVIGNPPYGKKGKLAIEFINHSLDIVDVVGFIVPLTLSTSWTAQKNIREDAELIYEMPLPKKSFEFEGKSVDVPSVFQIWRKKFKDLRLEKPQTEHPDLEIRIYNKADGAKKWLTQFDWDIAIKRNTSKGEYILKGEAAGEDYHWILVKGPIEKLKKIDWAKVNKNKMTAGMGKADIVKAYTEVCNDN